MLSAFLVLVFMTGGASRIDVQSLIVLRPASAVACALALITLQRKHLARSKLLVGGFSVVVLLSLLHLIPLPPLLWHALPGREVLAEIDRVVGLGDVWRPLTMTPLNGWHSLLSLTTPLAVLLFGIQLNEDDTARLLRILLILSALSGLLGILQVIGSPNGPLYFYGITNNGSAVGLFSNRNHAAVLLACVFPMLATFASSASGTQSRQRTREMTALGALIITVPLLLVTGSRSGLAIGVIGVAASAFLYKRPQKGRTVRKGGTRWRVGPGSILAVAAIVILGLITILFSRAEAFMRLFTQTAGDDTRVEFWALTVRLIGQYFPWGSGLGSFVEAYQLAEPASVLNPLYVNHAHNDWLEIPLTMGLPGVLALLAGLSVIGWRAFNLWRTGDVSKQAVRYGRMASVIIGMLALASVTDYPLRTPTMMAVLAINLLWLFPADRNSGESSFYRAVSQEKE
jgi:O-antigen ligase